MDESSGILTSGSAEVDDALWQYDGLHTAYQGECEEILLEMQMIFYEDLRAEPIARGQTGLLLSEELQFSFFNNGSSLVY